MLGILKMRAKYVVDIWIAFVCLLFTALASGASDITFRDAHQGKLITICNLIYFIVIVITILLFSSLLYHYYHLFIINIIINIIISIIINIIIIFVTIMIIIRDNVIYL